MAAAGERQGASGSVLETLLQFQLNRALLTIKATMAVLAMNLANNDCQHCGAALVCMSATYLVRNFRSKGKNYANSNEMFMRTVIESARRSNGTSLLLSKVRGAGGRAFGTHTFCGPAPDNSYYEGLAVSER